MTVEPEIVRIVPPFERLDAAAAPQFKSDLDANLPKGSQRVLLDLSNVDFVDSTGLGALVGLLKRLGGSGRIAVVGVKPAVRRLFQLTRLEELFNLSDSEEDAMNALGA